MRHPKIVILGAGSLFFGRKAIWQMVHSPHLQQGTLALVDTDPARLAKMKALAEKVAAHHDVPLRINASTDRRQLLPDADFVILSFARDNARYRGIDCELSAKYGIRMCSGDTIGPGGVLRAMREFPEIIRAARDIEELCPEAWVINYINPAAVHGMGLARFFPKLKSFAICDAQYELRQKYAEMAGLIEKGASLPPQIDRDLDLQSVGPNHFTWVLHFEHAGRDLRPALLETIHQRAQVEKDAEEADLIYRGSKGVFNLDIQYQLATAFGAIPTVVGHTKEYVRFYQGHGVTSEEIPPLQLFDPAERANWTANVWQRVDDYLSGAAPIAEFDTEFGPDPATDIIESMWAGLAKRFFINQPNRGAVPNMADDAYLELYSDLDMSGPRPLPTLPIPRGIRGMMEVILDTHELTAEAIYHEDRHLLRRALLTDPLTNSIGDTDALLAELISAERDALPRQWQHQ
ncbi:MAG: glycoside hydrolase family 4 [Puniceicoccaceae bacterium]